MSKQLTAKQIVDETARAYNLTNRAQNADGSCSYETEDGKNCAVGRCLMKKFRRRDIPASLGAQGLADYLGHSNLDELLLSRYRGHPLRFWRELQVLHDTSYNWTETGLSDRGKFEAERLIRLF